MAKGTGCSLSPFELKKPIENHLEFTGSAVAKSILHDWARSLARFVKVMPTDYKRVLQARKAGAPLPFAAEA